MDLARSKLLFWSLTALLGLFAGFRLMPSLFLNVSNISAFPHILTAQRDEFPICRSQPQVDYGSAICSAWKSGVTVAGMACGQDLAAHGDCEEAVEVWQRVIQAGGERTRIAQFELGRRLFWQGRRAEAVDVFRQGRLVEAVRGLGLKATAQGQTETARAWLELALDVEPTIEVATDLADLYQAAGEAGRAAETWNRVARFKSESEVDHWTALAEAASLHGDWSNAQSALERAAALSPDPYDVNLRLGRVLMKTHAWSDAIEVSAKAIELKPAASSEPYSQAGVASAELGRYADAMHWFDLALERIPRDPWPNIRAGEVAEEFGMTAEAERRLQAAVTVAPDHWGALYSLSAFLSRQGRAGEAVPYLERIADDTNCSVLSLLIEGYMALGQTQRAMEVRQHSTQDCPQ